MVELLSLDSWNNLILWSLAGTALCAAIGWFSTYAALDLQKVESEAAKVDLERYKADAGKAIAEASARSTEAQLELARLKAPRAISDAQADTLKSLLKPYAGTTFDVSTYPGDAETASLAARISATLIAAGWVEIPTDSQPIGLVSGVFVQLNDITSITQAGTAIRTPSPVEDQAAASFIEALRVSGITTGFAGRQSLAVSPKRVVVRLIVGKKP